VNDRPDRETLELETATARAVEDAMVTGASAAEAYAEESSGREIRVFDGDVESLTDAGQRGVGVRAWIDGRVGYAYGTDLSDDGLGAIGKAAVEAARVADPDEFAAPSDADDATVLPEIEGLFDERLGEWTTEQKIELAKEVERAARAADSRVTGVETAVYVDERSRVAITTSAGLQGGFEATTCYAYLQAIAAEDGDKQTGLGFGVGRSPATLDSEAIGREGGERAARLLGAKKPGSRTCPVVLDQTVAASFVGFIGSTLCADSVQRGRSPFAGRLGDSIASTALTLTDLGTDPEGLSSSPFDAEGTPRGETPLVAAGELAAYLHDAYTARREGGGTRSTANAERSGYRSPPSVGTSNLIVAPGERTLEDLLAEAADGIYVTDVAGLHSGVNPVSGTFSVGATGLVIREGKLAEPADEFTIASDLESMLSAVAAAGSEARWVPFAGSVKTPALLIGEMAVAGS
jgi:PmbA protein